MYPCLHIDLDKIAENARTMKELTGRYGIEITGVTKVFGGEPRIASTLTAQGIRKLGDSRIENIKKYASLDCEKWLIRMPSISEAEDAVRYCDVTVNSEIETLEALNRAALHQGKIHKVILMADLGDLREGYIKEEELARAAAYVKEKKGLELYGLGTNLTCFSFIQSDEEKMNRLLTLAGKYDAATCLHKKVYPDIPFQTPLLPRLFLRNCRFRVHPRRKFPQKPDGLYIFRYPPQNASSDHSFVFP